MSETTARWADRAANLQRAFDRSFAEPPPLEAAALEDFLAIRLGPDGYAIGLADIAKIVTYKPLTRIPGSVAALIGIAGFRGVIVPVYHLGILLGQPAAETPRWLAIASRATVAFAFDAFKAHLRIPRDDLLPLGAGEQSHSHVRAFVHADGVAWPVVHLPSVLAAIRRHASAPTKQQDR